MAKNSIGRIKRRIAGAKHRDKNKLLPIQSKIKKVIMDKEPEYIERDKIAADIIASYTQTLQGHHEGLELHRGRGLNDECSDAVVVADSSIRMANNHVKALLHGKMSDQGSRLDNRSFRSCGLLKENARLNWDDGRGIAIKVPMALTLTESIGALIWRDAHMKYSDGWNKSCQAEGNARANNTLGQLKNSGLMSSAGLRRTNVKEILRIGPKEDAKTPATGVKFEYKNESNDTVTRPFGSLIDRYTWGDKEKIHTICREHPEAEAYYKKIRSLYMYYTPFFLQSHGWPEESIPRIMEELEHTLGMATLITSAIKPMGIHQDPPTPTPAAVSGPTTYGLDENGQWYRKHNGGQLFLADFMFNLEYGPQDFVLFDGNLAHGVTGLRHLKCTKAKEREELSRFSMITFSRWRKERMKNPGNYNGSYQPGKTYNF